VWRGIPVRGIMRWLWWPGLLVGSIKEERGGEHPRRRRGVKCAGLEDGLSSDRRLRGFSFYRWFEESRKRQPRFAPGRMGGADGGGGSSLLAWSGQGHACGWGGGWGGWGQESWGGKGWGGVGEALLEIAGLSDGNLPVIWRGEGERKAVFYYALIGEDGAHENTWEKRGGLLLGRGEKGA